MNHKPFVFIRSDEFGRNNIVGVLYGVNGEDYGEGAVYRLADGDEMDEEDCQRNGGVFFTQEELGEYLSKVIAPE